MTTKELAKRWLEVNHPQFKGSFRVSRYYPKKDIWFFTFPSSYFDSSKVGNLTLLLQEKVGTNFIFLEIPYSYFLDQKNKLDIRTSGDKFDLHLSAKKRNWLECERSEGVSFASFEK